MNAELIAQGIAIAHALAAAGAPPTPASGSTATHPLIGKHVLVRDNRAGVYVGTLTRVDIEGGKCALSAEDLRTEAT